MPPFAGDETTAAARHTQPSLDRANTPFPARLEDCHAEIARLRAELAARDKGPGRREPGPVDHQKGTFARALSLARMGIWECTLPENTLVWSEGVYDIFGLPRGSALERARIAERYPPASLAELERLRCLAISEGSGFELDAEIVTRIGDHRWIRITATVETDAGAVTRIFGTKQDITEEKLALDRIRYLAAHDVMTGLANRAAFQERLAEMNQPSMLADAPFCLLLIDLDGFKTLNDTFGHAVGDDCLRETARRLKGLFGDTTLIARIGGDEFAVLVECRRETRLIPLLGQRVVQELKRTVTFGAVDVEIGASVGLAFADGGSAESLVKNADIALYAAKAAGRGRYILFQAPGQTPQRDMSAA